MDDDGQHIIEDCSDGIPTVPEAPDQQVTIERSIDTRVAHSSTELQQPGAVNHQLRIAFSVYTATNGYDWSNIPEGNEREGLDFYYQKAVERKPDFMSPGDVIKGAFAYDGTIAAFRIQVVKHWDSFGRNADYCAFAFLPYEDACRVDFDTLLDMPEFTDPRRDPPTSISYSGEASKDINSEDSVAAIKKLYNGESLQSFDFAKIGALLSAHGNKSASWLFCKVECAIEDSTTVSTGTWNDDPYPPPPPPTPPPPPPPEEAIKIPLSAAQPIAAVVLPEMTQDPQPSSAVESSGSQGTVVTDVCLHTRAPTRVAQRAYRAPATGIIRNVRGETCVLTPVSVEEMNRSVAQKSNGLFGLDTLTVVLMGVCAVLVVVLLIILFYFIIPRNDPKIHFGDAAGVVNITKEIDGTQIRSLGEEKPKPSIEKGGK